MEFINGNKATLLIHEEITEELAKEINSFIYSLEYLPEVNEIYVSINSGGGSVMGAYSIFSALKNSTKKIITCIEGIAASAAGIIFLAGSVRMMTDYSVWMGHNPDGGSDKVLNVIKESLLIILESAFPDEDNLDEMMNEETWIDAETMKQKGVIQTIIYTEVDKLDTSMNVTNLYQICNDILKKKNSKMTKEKKSVVEKGKDLINKIISKPKTKEVINETDPEEETDEYTDDSEETEETKDEVTLDSLAELIQTLIEKVDALSSDEETEEVENADDTEEDDKKKEEVENKKKLEILNKSNFAKEDFSKLMKYNIATIEDFTKQPKGIVKAPKIEINNEADVNTDFNSLSKEGKMQLLNSNPALYHQLFRNSGTKRKV